MHPATAAILEFFQYEHLQDERLRQVSLPFCELAHRAVAPRGERSELYDGRGLGLDGAEATAALRKLLEAKDCAVRAALSS